MNLNFKHTPLSHWASLFCLTIFMGLFFQTAWQYPVVDSFPLIERLLNPSFLQNDFYSNTFDAFSPRLILASCIAATSQFLDVHYTHLVAYSNILRIWIYAIGLYLFFKHLVNRDIALVAFCLAALSFLSVPFLPAWWPVTFDFTASNIALTFSMYAWVFILKRSVTFSLILLSFSVLFHPLVGVHSAIIAVILFLTYHGIDEFLKLFKQPMVYLAGLIYSAIFLAMYLSFDNVLDDQRFVEINGHFRHGHHFIISHMDPEKWITTFLMMAASILILIKSSISINIKRTAFVFYIYSIVLTVLGYIFTELYPTRFMVSFIPMRAFPIIVPLMVLTWAYFAFEYFKKGNYIVFLLLFLPFLPYKQVGLTWFLFPNQHDLFLTILLIITTLIIAIMSPQLSVVLNFANKIIEKVSIKIATQSSLLILPIAILALSLSLYRFDLDIPTVKNDVAIYQWLTQHTTKDDVILTELNGANNQKIRLLSQRAVVISKDFPFNEHFYEEWYDRYQSVYQERDLARGRIDNLSGDKLNQLMDKYASTILIRTKPINDSANFSLIGETQGETAPVFVYRNNNLEAL